MSIIDGTGLGVWEGGLFLPGSDLLRRVQWAFAKIRDDGGDIELNEAGRPFGVPGDANVTLASETASGISTVWFQWGRFLRGETPSAADPRSGNVLASEHTQGIAIDCDAKDIFTATLRAKYFAQAGLKNTIPSESWHWAIRGNPLVDISTTTASSGATPIPTGDEFDMASLDDLRKIVTDVVNAREAAAEARNRRETRFRVWKNNATGNYMIGSYANGNYKLLGGTHQQQESELASLSQNGYLMIDAGDAASPQGVDPTIWANIIAKFEEIKTNHPGTLTN